MMNSADASLQRRAASVPLMAYVLTLGGPFIGFVGASLVLASMLQPNLFTVGNMLQSLGPLLTAPAMIRSAWSNHQPSWVLAGLSFLVLWSLIFSDGTVVAYRATLIFMVGFLFTGLSNIVMGEEPGRKNRDFDFSTLKSAAGYPKLLAFILEDILITLQVGFTGTLQLIAQPLKGLFTGGKESFLPPVLSTKTLWKSRRFGGFYFSVAGLMGILGASIPAFEAKGNTLFNVIGGFSAFIVNYSLFFSGLKGKHWLDKLLIPGSILATIGSSARTFTWGFALDQFGSRLNEMYMCGIPLIKQDEAANAETEMDTVEALEKADDEAPESLNETQERVTIKT